MTLSQFSTCCYDTHCQAQTNCSGLGDITLYLLEAKFEARWRVFWRTSGTSGLSLDAVGMPRSMKQVGNQ